MAARTKPTAQKQPLVVTSLAFTPATRDTLQRFGRDLSDVTGLSISASGTLRALVSWAAQQPDGWAARVLLPFVDQELAQGRKWGGMPPKRGAAPRTT